MHISLSLFSDAEVLNETARLVKLERRATAKLLAALAELDSRKLYLGEGCSSLFTYCTQVLHLSEPAAYSRITAARTARRFPAILEMLSNGDVNLTTITLLATHLDDDNHVPLLESARHKSKRDVERIVAALDPMPDIVAHVRKVPASKTGETGEAPFLRPPAEVTNRASDTNEPIAPSATAVRRPVMAALAPDRYYLKVTIGRDTHEKLQRARDLLRHAIPNGDPAEVIDRALTALLDQLLKYRSGIPARSVAPRQSLRPRHIPAAVKRAVWTRDQGRCAFEGANGRCTETAFLELHHVRPFADGGPSTLDNLELRCRAHNAYETQVHIAGIDSLFEAESAPAIG